MANQNKSFLTEEERGVLTPTSACFPKDARERFFEAEGDIEAVLKYVPTNTKKVNDRQLACQKGRTSCGPFLIISTRT